MVINVTPACTRENLNELNHTLDNIWKRSEKLQVTLVRQKKTQALHITDGEVTNELYLQMGGAPTECTKEINIFEFNIHPGLTLMNHVRNVDSRA